MLRNSTSSNQRISVTSDASGGSGGTLWCRIFSSNSVVMRRRKELLLTKFFEQDLSERGRF